MSKHFRGADGSLLKADKRWSDLSNKQKEKIAGWMREAFQKHYPDDEAVLDDRVLNARRGEFGAKLRVVLDRDALILNEHT